MPWHTMPGRPGSHSTYVRGEDMVAEWYDHGEDAPYESANMLVLARDAQQRLAEAMSLPLETGAEALAVAAAARFGSWFEFRDFLKHHGIEVRRETDFWP